MRAGSTGEASAFILLTTGLVGGILSGLLGVGGGIVLVPILVLLLHYTQKNGQATSLAAITLTALSGAVSYGTAGDVRLLPAAVVAVGGLAGAVIGVGLVRRLSENQVRFVFALLMVAVAVRLLWPTTGVGDTAEVAALTPLVMGGYLLAGLSMGVLSALLGVGGGAILVPAFILGFGMSPHEAQGTSLAVMVPVSLMGAWRNARHGYTDWRGGAWLGVGGVAGAPLGAWLALLLPAEWLSRIFAIFLLFSAVQLIRRARAQRIAS
ncbi:sulfite exporter TauE/SafE family protein [Tessaracoccus antarcticus]|uniref:sulfite exporter TauE/SafE family protein n=1 Tax=Tessaracoccus antarcticus TaxID=2479848 RepID=UPI001314DB1D|nr:sulfite exporter TauE/SafE family protein [Tessaracoccus antarcticus]